MTRPSGLSLRAAAVSVSTVSRRGQLRANRMTPPRPARSASTERSSGIRVPSKPTARACPGPGCPRPCLRWSSLAFMSVRRSPQRPDTIYDPRHQRPSALRGLRFDRVVPDENVAHVAIVVFLRAWRRRLRGRVTVLFADRRAQTGPDTHAPVAVRTSSGFQACAPNHARMSSSGPHLRARHANGHPDALDTILTTLCPSITNVPQPVGPAAHPSRAPSPAPPDPLAATPSPLPFIHRSTPDDRHRGSGTKRDEVSGGGSGWPRARVDGDFGRGT